MAGSNLITIYYKDSSPISYDLASFKKDCILMGRGPKHGSNSNPNCPVNDISLPSRLFPFVSKAHCTFYRYNGVWHIRDDNSLNGLTFNNQRISDRDLHNGDKYYIEKNSSERLVIAFSSGLTARKGKLNSFSLRDKDRYVLGRSRSCDIVIAHPSVSRRHCMITREGGQYFITDNNSTNGVILNGCPLRGKTALHSMDRLTIASSSFVFSNGLLFESQAMMGGVSVAVNHLYKKVGRGAKRKLITKDVSLSIEPGEFVAIIGGSGAGKTTLLNCLSGMTDYTSGEILINGENVRSNEKSLKSIMGYVPQNDIVYDNLTLERMLFYSAKLRMPQDTEKREIQNKIEETLRLVELEDHRGTMISKLSGGQRKRASIAVELLASPSLFFLDEPSSGLDPGTEKHLMSMLKKLANTGKTVIMITHTVQNINLCDRVICMGKGGVLCYSGSSGNALIFFGKQQMTDVYDDLNEHSMEAAARFKNISGIRKINGNELKGNTRAALNHNKEKESFNPIRAVHGFFRQFFIMSNRYFELMLNNRGRMALLLVLPIVLTVLVCIAFEADGEFYNFCMRNFGLRFERKSFPFFKAENTKAMMFAFACAAFWVGIFNSIQEISKEREIYRREQFTGVRPTAYVFSKFVILTVLCFLQTIIMTGIFLFLCDTTATEEGDVLAESSISLKMPLDGLVFKDGGMWLEIFVTSFTCVLSAMCLGLTVSAAVSNEMAIVICPICLLPQILFSGVVSELTGITKAISGFIPCRWVCISFFSSLNTNGLYDDTRLEMGKRIGYFYDPLSGGSKTADMAYNGAEKTYLWGLNPVLSAWVVLLLMSLFLILCSISFLKWRKQKV